jgi:Cu+-exporting ATPase
MTATQPHTTTTCYHCGNLCDNHANVSHEKNFCCSGCRSVYELLHEAQLSSYYYQSTAPGQTQSATRITYYDALDVDQFEQRALVFKSATRCTARFSVPAIHCISCLWLLENMKRLSPGITNSHVNFQEKTVHIEFDPKQITTRGVAELMARIGYPPVLAADLRHHEQKTQKLLVAKIAVAGFAFGNVMLLSFPEYLGLPADEAAFKNLFAWLALLLALPVALFSAHSYFLSAYHSVRHRQINIDVPIATGLAALLCRSTYEVIWLANPGYLDSFTGLVFFLLIGKWFQDKTFRRISFDRDYTSYFPLAVLTRMHATWQPMPIEGLKAGMHVRVRHQEVIPADGILLSAQALVDYSFVTGEADAVPVEKGARVFAGGRVADMMAEIMVSEPASKSYLTRLWGHEVFDKVNKSKQHLLIDRVAKYFTWLVLVLAACTGMFWLWYEPGVAWLAVTSVLLVGCPCALALAHPFTYGSALRWLAQHGLFLKSATVAEKLAGINMVVFDKTGTLTNPQSQTTTTATLSDQEQRWIKSVAACSVHPLSKKVYEHLETVDELSPEEFEETIGQGASGRVNGHQVKIGSADFTGAPSTLAKTHSQVHVQINGEYKGHFSIATSLRPHIQNTLKALQHLPLWLVSGDTHASESLMKEVFPKGAKLLFQQTPHDKMELVCTLQSNGGNVLMVGDGLNDAGALKASYVGLAVAENNSLYAPACDGIVAGDAVGKLPVFLAFARHAHGLLRVGFGVSLLYNCIALSFAVSGMLSPLIAAILMPLSSISVVTLATTGCAVLARKTLCKSV